MSTLLDRPVFLDHTKVLQTQQIKINVVTYHGTSLHSFVTDNFENKFNFVQILKSVTIKKE
jgi:hypothetical protein